MDSLLDLGRQRSIQCALAVVAGDAIRHLVELEPPVRPPSVEGPDDTRGFVNPAKWLWDQIRPERSWCRGGAVCRRQFRLIPLVAARFRWQNPNLLIFLGFGFSCQREGRQFESGLVLHLNRP